MRRGRENFRRRSYRQYRFYYAAKRWFARRISHAGWLAVAFLIILGFFGMDTNLTVAYQAFAFVLALILVSWITARLGRTKFTARRVLPRFVTVGTPSTYQVELKNLGRWPLRDVHLQEELNDPRPTLEEFLTTPEPGEEKRNWLDRSYGFYRWQWLIEINERALINEVSVPRCQPKTSVEVEVSILPKRRGVLHFHNTVLAAADPLGLFRSLTRKPVADKLLILPKRYPIPHFALPGNMQYQQGGVALAASVGESEEFVSLRDYRPGDPMRHIHWRSWARTGKPIVKEFQDEFFVRHALILDTFEEMAYSERFEEAVAVAASFACTIQSQDSLLDLMFVGAQAYCFTAGRGLAHTEQMLEILAAVNICQDKKFESLGDVVLEHIPVVSGCICVFLKWDEARQDFVRKLRALEVPLAVFVLSDADAADITGLGPMTDRPESFYQLKVGSVEERLRNL